MPWVAPPNFVNLTVVTEAQLDAISDNLNAGVMRPIAETTLSGAAATVDFPSIPATFRNLMVTSLARSDNGATNVEMYARINNVVTAGTYHSQAAFATTTTLTASEYAGTVAGVWMGVIPAAGASSSIQFGAAEMTVFDYLNTSSMKVFRTVSAARYGGAGSLKIMHIGATWDNGTAINQITLWLSAGNFVTNSRFTLYGIPA